MPFGVQVQVLSRAPDRNSSVEALSNTCFRGFFHLKETSFLLLIVLYHGQKLNLWRENLFQPAKPFDC